MKTINILIVTAPGSEDSSRALSAVLVNPGLPEARITEEGLTDTPPPGTLRTPGPAKPPTPPDLVIICLARATIESVGAALDSITRRFRKVPVIVAMEDSNPRLVGEVLERGASDFITPPFRSVDLQPRIWRLHRRHTEDDPLVLALKEKLGLRQLVGESPALLAAIRKIPPIAHCDASVLIAGETGTGKEMFARAIHQLSPRSSKPFVPVNCGAIPVELVENEFFGHESGAYTGARGPSVGLLGKCDGGTLFLDEVDSLPLLAQVKLLRFLQEKEFRPLGSNRTCRVDLRVISASNASLEEAVRQGRLRRDLFFRLNVIQLQLPPLRERSEDIPLLARHFIAKHSQAAGSPVRDISAAAIQRLRLHEWSGNIRELENVIESSIVLCDKEVLDTADIQLPEPPLPEGTDCFQVLKNRVVTQFERDYISKALREHKGNISKAASAAGKHRRAFWELMRKHGIRTRVLNEA